MSIPRFFAYSLLGVLLSNSLAFSVVQTIQSKMNSNGDTATVYVDYLTGNFDLIATILPVSGSWSTPVTLESSSPQKFPRLAINSSGNIIVVWVMYDTLNYVDALYTCYYDSGTTTWSSVSQITGSNVSITSDFTVSLSDNDWVCITWSAYDSNLNDTVAQAVSGTLGSLGSVTTIS